MIIERYINRTNIRLKIKKANEGRKEADADVVSKETMRDSSTPRSLSIHVKQVHTSDTILNQRTSVQAVN